MVNQNMNMLDTLDTLEAMLHQEDCGYVVPAFLGHLPQHTSFGQSVDPEARASIAEWCYKIMNICHYTNNTAEIAVSCLDRFVSTREGYECLLDRTQYQLAALAAVYTSVKVHEQQALTPALVAKLSNGAFSKENIEEMERRILQGLKWKINPPTTMDFVRLFLSLIPDDVLDLNSRTVILELSQYQVDRSIIEYDLCQTKASSVAFAALLNSVESIFSDGMMGSYVESLIAHYANMDSYSIQGLRDRLYEVISNHPEAAMLVQKTEQAQKSTSTPAYRFNMVKPAPKSPRSVFMSS